MDDVGWQWMKRDDNCFDKLSQEVLAKVGMTKKDRTTTSRLTSLLKP